MRPRLFFVSFFFVAGSISEAATIYVDRQITLASCTNYAPGSRTCSGGTERAYQTLSGGSGAAGAGDTVLVRGGTYGEQFAPVGSGTAGLPITYQAYPGEKPTISGLSDVALWLIQTSYLVIDGLTVTNVGGWGRLEDATNNVIRNCTFSNATIDGTTGGLKLVRSSFNKILNNHIDNGTDDIVIQESDRNVVQGNAVSTGRHSLLSLRCGNYNVVRGNSFSNPIQKDLEIYDCEGTSDAPVKLDATKHNLVEDNVIADTLGSDADYRYNGIQYAGQQGIVRRNVFRDDMGGGVNFQYYSDESLYNNRNRVYHNTFYGNRCSAVAGNSGAANQFFDNRVRNNILYKNSDCSGSGGQTSIDDPSQVILTDNALATSDPGFVNETGRDFHLVTGSAMIDAGAFLTPATSGGSGTSLPVADAGYFYDGFQFPGEVGDLIQLQGQTTTARIVSINYTTNTLTLDTPLTWTSGQGVALAYAGSAPDLGAFEAVPPPTPAVAARFYTVSPCRVVDTRSAAGKRGGPALVAGTNRIFPIAGACAVPASARAVSLNLTVTQGTTAGFLTLYPTGGALPSSSAINYSAGQTRANSVVVGLGNGGEVTARCGQALGTTHAIFDVVGYFQ